MKQCLLTFHGRLVCHDPGGLSQADLDGPGTLERLLWLDLPEDFTRPTYPQFIADAAVQSLNIDLPGYPTSVASVHLPGNFVVFEIAGKFLSTPPNGTLNFNAPRVGGWERFVLVPETALRHVLAMRNENWVLKSSRELIRGETIGFATGHHLQIGSLLIPAAYSLPLDQTRAPFCYPVYADGWRVEELYLFKPFMYFVAFGNNARAQLNICLRSLAEIGHYDGKILVFTDQPEDELRGGHPWLQPGQISAASLPAQDFVGFVAGKYGILEVEEAYQYQPVVYMDPDIVFNTDVTPMLREMAVAGRITAPLEYHALRGTNPAAGASLLQRDFLDARLSAGFNAGTLGIPNLPGHRHSLEMTRRVIENYLSIHGRKALKWVDQEAANYIAFKLGDIDTSEISKFVRYANRWNTNMKTPRTGLIHFWGVPRAERPAVMQSYLDHLISATTC